MFSWLKDKARKRRANAYLKQFPEDAPAVEAILVSNYPLAARSAREVFEMLAGRQVGEEVWSQYRARWERAWKAII